MNPVTTENPNGLTSEEDIVIVAIEDIAAHARKYVPISEMPRLLRGKWFATPLLTSATSSCKYDEPAAYDKHVAKR